MMQYINPYVALGEIFQFMQFKTCISQPAVDILAREEKARYTAEEEEKRIELLTILTVHVNK